MISLSDQQVHATWITAMTLTLKLSRCHVARLVLSTTDLRRQAERAPHTLSVTYKHTHHWHSYVHDIQMLEFSRLWI